MIASSLRRMSGRDTAEHHRVATSLELLFDLVFVVAISLSSSKLHQLEEQGDIAGGITVYLMVFFAIWWSWMNFTWFASAFDTDDWLYRITTFIQMGGALVLAAGTLRAMESRDFGVILIGYLIMRLAMVSQWIRVAVSEPQFRTTAVRYAIGIVVVQLAWTAFVVIRPEHAIVYFVLIAAAELAVPAFAEQSRRTPWHPRHIADRYGGFTLIVLGESVLSTAAAMVDAVEAEAEPVRLVVIAMAGLAIVCSMWWVYFTVPQHRRLLTTTRVRFWGYAHYVVFAAVGAFSGGLELLVYEDTHGTEADVARSSFAFTIPVAVYVVACWFVLIRRSAGIAVNIAMPAVAVAIAFSAMLPFALVVAAVLTMGAAALASVAARYDRESED